MSDWRPIETAPKDGTRILAYPCWDRNPGVEIVRWGGRYGWEIAYSGDAVVCQPTLWMPLPTPQSPP